MILDLYHLMAVALQQAEEAFSAGEVPVGAVVADETGRLLGTGRNRSITLNDPTAHAEIQAMRAASQAVENYRLPGSILVVTLEPCVMCMGAAVQARIARLVFGAHDPKAGAAESLYHVGKDRRLNHQIKITTGIMAEDCGALLKKFFRARRQRRNYRS